MDPVASRLIAATKFSLRPSFDFQKRHSAESAAHTGGARRVRSRSRMGRRSRGRLVLRVEPQYGYKPNSSKLYRRWPTSELEPGHNSQEIPQTVIESIRFLGQASTIIIGPAKNRDFASAGRRPSV